LSRQRVLIVEDQDSIRNATKDYLEQRSYDVVACENCKKQLKLSGVLVLTRRPVINSLPDGTGLEILTSIKSSDPMIPVIILTANGTIELAVEALEKGAENLLTKPIEMSALLVVSHSLAVGGYPGEGLP
jgi:DNA-binding NtrC family response regulator